MAQSPAWMQNTNWRDSGRQVKIGPFDGRLTLFLLVFFLFPGKISLIIAVIAFLVFYGLEYIGYTLPNAMRKIMSLIAGKRRNGVHYWRQHKFKY